MRSLLWRELVLIHGGQQALIRDGELRVEAEHSALARCDGR